MTTQQKKGGKKGPYNIKSLNARYVTPHTRARELDNVYGEVHSAFGDRPRPSASHRTDAGALLSLSIAFFREDQKYVETLVSSNESKKKKKEYVV